MPREISKDAALWTRVWRLHYAEARHRFPTADLDKLRARVTKAMIATHGPCPQEPSSDARLSFTERLVVWFAVRKLSKALKGKEVVVNPFLKKLIVSVCYGVGAAAPVVTLALADNVISGNEWGGIAAAFFTAGWGTFKSNTTIVGAAREGETVTNFGPKSTPTRIYR